MSPRCHLPWISPSIFSVIFNSFFPDYITCLNPRQSEDESGFTLSVNLLVSSWAHTSSWKPPLLSPTIPSSCCDPVSDWKVVHGWAALQCGPDETVPFSHFSLHWNGISSRVALRFAVVWLLCVSSIFPTSTVSSCPILALPPQPYFLQLFCLLMAPQAYYHSLSSRINDSLSCRRAFVHAIANPQRSSSSPHRAQPSSADL